MKKLNILYTALTFITMGNAIAQQDRHLSLWNESTSFLNPGSVAAMDADLRFVSNFRMQWMGLEGNAFRTNTFGLEAKLFKQRNESCLGVGLNFTNDQTGDMKVSSNLLSIPINYTIAADDNLFFSIGLAPGFYQQTIKSDAITWNNQWDGQQYNQGIASNENIASGQSVFNFDLGAGFNFRYKFEDESVINLGIGVNHITGQDASYTLIENKIFRSINIFASGTKYIPDRRLGISPSLLMSFMGPNRNIVFGTNFDIELFEASRRTDYVQRSFFSLGMHYRVQDALIALASFKFSGFKVGLSYDINISSLTPTTRGNGGFEIHLAYAMMTDANSRIHDRHFRWNRGRGRR